MLPLLQTFCRKDALCTDNHRHAGWNPALRNARHLSKLSVLHWPLPEGTQKVCLCERFVSGMGSKRFGLSAPCGAVCGNMTWAQRGKCGMQNQGCCDKDSRDVVRTLVLISVMHTGSIWRSWPIISLSTSSLSCCAVICSVACSKCFSVFCQQSFMEMQPEGCSVQNPSCCALPKLLTLGRTGVLWLSRFHNAEWEDAVLSIPILHIQIFPSGSLLSRRRKFCSRIGNRELSTGGERETSCHKAFAMLVWETIFCKAVSYYQIPLSTQTVSPELAIWWLLFYEHMWD